MDYKYIISRRGRRKNLTLLVVFANCPSSRYSFMVHLPVPLKPFLAQTHSVLFCYHHKALRPFDFSKLPNGQISQCAYFSSSVWCKNRQGPYGFLEKSSSTCQDPQKHSTITFIESSKIGFPWTLLRRQQRTISGSLGLNLTPGGNSIYSFCTSTDLMMNLVVVSIMSAQKITGLETNRDHW